MAGIFETATRAAIEEIISKNVEKSRFGYMLTEDGFQDLTDDIYNLLDMSRRLKDAGDKMLQVPTGASEQKSPRLFR